MKIAFDVDVLAKQYDINTMVHKVAVSASAHQPVLQASVVLQGM